MACIIAREPMQTTSLLKVETLFTAGSLLFPLLKDHGEFQKQYSVINFDWDLLQSNGDYDITHSSNLFEWVKQ